MSSSAAFSPEHNHLPPPSDELCYVQCNYCNTILAVAIPHSCMSLETVTVRCGNCSKLLSVNKRANLSSSAATANRPCNVHNFFSHQNIMEEVRNNLSNLLINQPIPDPSGPVRVDELLIPPVVNRPPEKSQTVPCAYNRFIKEEIQCIKAGNPDISHRKAFSAAEKNLAHVSHQEPHVSDSYVQLDPPCIAFTRPCFNWVSNKHV